ncbi:MAG TPA: gamma-glutamylcyclotransferase family protein [Bacillota bacterium]|nr:gamma-glutamylcyclotransferase family protein [Bacillota bacterium]
MWLFTYGTLTRRGRMEALAGRRLPDPVVATLAGFRKHDTGYGYPIILPAEGSEVEGLLWEVAVSDLPALDHYEGTDESPPFYHRQDVEVSVAGERRPAQVFVGNPDAIWPRRTES